MIKQYTLSVDNHFKKKSFADSTYNYVHTYRKYQIHFIGVIFFSFMIFHFYSNNMDVQKIIRIALRIFNLHIYNLQYYLIYHTIEGFYVISMGSGYIYIYIYIYT